MTFEFNILIKRTNLLETLWLENIPSTSINSFEMISKMRANSVVRVIGIDDTYDWYDRFIPIIHKLESQIPGHK